MISAWARLALLVSLASLVGSAARAADPPGEAEAAITRGISYRKQGDDHRALEEFRRAYALERSPRALAQIGLAQMALGHWVEASDALEGALAVMGDPWIQKNRRPLADSLAQVGGHIGNIEVEGDPPGATVSLNGVAVGTMPLRTKATAGDVVISVAAPGRVLLTRKVIVEPRGIVRESFTLPPVPSSLTVGAVAGPAVPTTRTTAPHEADIKQTRFGRLPWWIGGAALVGVGVGMISTIVARDRLSDFNAACGLTPGSNTPVHDPMSGTAKTDAECANLYSSWSDDRRWAMVGFVMGGALGAGALVLLLLNTEGQPSGGSSMASACLPTGTGISCVARF